MVIFILIKNKYEQLQTRVPDPGHWQFLSSCILRCFLARILDVVRRRKKNWIHVHHLRDTNKCIKYSEKMLYQLMVFHGYNEPLSATCRVRLTRTFIS